MGFHRTPTREALSTHTSDIDGEVPFEGTGPRRRRIDIEAADSGAIRGEATSAIPEAAGAMEDSSRTARDDEPRLSFAYGLGGISRTGLLSHLSRLRYWGIAALGKRKQATLAFRQSDVPPASAPC